MNRSIAVLAIGCALSVMAPAASAAVAVSSASITNIRIEVIDLDPNDGITASFAFITNPLASAEGFHPSGSVVDVGSPQSPFNVAAGAFAPIGKQIGQAGLWGYSATVGPDSLNASAFETRAGSWGHATALVTAGNNQGSIDAPVLQQLLLAVTPHTRLNITADLDASAALDCAAADQIAYRCSSTAFAFLQFNGAFSLADAGNLAYFGSNSSYVQAVGNETQSLNGALSWASNPHDEWAVLGLQAMAYADASLIGIPEPSTVALLALACVGLLATSRRRQA